jgi:hypothetical protein
MERDLHWSRAMIRTRARVLAYGNGFLALGLGAYFFLIPAILVLSDVHDPALREGNIPRAAWRLHRSLTPRYERWARERIVSGRAATVHHLNVPATEWPVFGCVFYLWATENLQAAWESDPSLDDTAPAARSRATIEACKDLLLDPNHHAWVRTHYGDDYLHTDNVFFRSLVVAGLTSYEKLTGSTAHRDVLRDQVETLAADLDASPFGVLDDYPGECYPIDCFAAVAWIRRADAVLGTDHSGFVERERRAFTGDRLDADGLIPWQVRPRSGRQLKPSRGIVNSHVLIFAPELYPDLARSWYATFEELFWQEMWYGAGWREFRRTRPDSEWTFDVDSGPIIGGFSPSASAYGIAAARANGRLDHAYTLAAQALAVSWPLPDGRLVGARALSDPDHAPYLGEANLLWLLTEGAGPPPEGGEVVGGGHLAGPVWIALGVFCVGSLCAAALARANVRRRAALAENRRLTLRLIVWIPLVLTGITMLVIGWFAMGGAVIIAAQLAGLMGVPQPEKARKPAGGRRGPLRDRDGNAGVGLRR